MTTTPAARRPIINLDDWKRSLRLDADGLDLDTPDGRADFRVRVTYRASRTPVWVLRAILRHLGYGSPAMARGAVTRQLADFWTVLDEDARRPSDEDAPDPGRAAIVALIEEQRVKLGKLVATSLRAKRELPRGSTVRQSAADDAADADQQLQGMRAALAAYDAAVSAR